MTQFFAFALGIIGLCKIMGNIFNYELLMAKYIQCLYHVGQEEEKEGRVSRKLSESSLD